jgi:acyl-coenzyme A synthetase/AMP-(fatty) acid ligase
VPFVHRLSDFGDRLAVITTNESLTYRELAERVETAAEILGTTRRLVLVATANDLDTLITYLAALHGGHPVLLTSTDQLDPLIAAYDPDVIGLRELRIGTAHDLHPDLALLLSTSGSTGSPKLVRLSARNLQANAEAIGDYLDIRDTDRAATTLPMHYCYGLSVINSNLARGAALILSDHSVVDRCFWESFRAHGGTSLHGVPYTFDLLDRAGFADRDLPTLRYVTQAGGRLSPDQVRRYAGLADRDGWQLFVMYGQTEATARMAYLPPDLAARRPEAVGVPVPGGAFEIRPDGELVYRGPNVMLGYARTPADLALGATLDALPTGDLARRTPDGLYEVIGRKSRFVKLFGLRVDLDEIERILSAAGFQAAAAGDDSAVILAMVNGQNTAAAASLVARRTNLPMTVIHVREYPRLPRLTSGKLDYAAFRSYPQAPPNQDHPTPPTDRLDQGRPPGEGWGLRGGERGLSGDRQARARPSEVDTVRGIYRRALNISEVPDDATFVSLGGDSLTYVRASIDLERLLGHVPEDWHTIPVTELDRARPRTGPLRSLETNILLRAMAITLIVCTHIGLTQIWGGAHLLLVIAGWSFGRFALAPVDPDRIPGRIARAATRIAVPSVLYLSWRAFMSDDMTLANALLINNFVQAGSISYWYVEVLVQILAMLALMFTVPALRRRAVTHGFALAMGVLIIALIARVPAVHIPMPNGFSARDMSLHGAFWLFVLGWVAQRAATSSQRVATIIVALLLIPGYFDDPVRDGIVVGGLLLVLLVPRVLVPAPVVRIVGLLAGASLYIYLTHYVVFAPLLPLLPLWAVAVITLAVGIAAWRGVCLLGRLRARTPTSLT